MERRRHTPEQAVREVREGERMLGSGTDLSEVLRHLEITESAWHRWRHAYAGMSAGDARRLKELEAENARLKKLLAEAELDKAMLMELAEGNGDPGPPQRKAKCRRLADGTAARLRARRPNDM